MRRARVLVADPPWFFRDNLPGRRRGAAKHYRCMSLAEICCFPLPPLADDALLFLWRVASMQIEALAVGQAWGFGAPTTEIVWEKTTRTGKPHFGMGRVFRASHETCLVFKRGRPKILSRSIRTRFEAPVREHSEKPDRFFEIVEAVSPGPYVELFARRQRPGWRCFGLELGDPHPEVRP